MNQFEDPAFLANRLMMGPDGAVHAVPTGATAVSPPGEMEAQPAAAPQASASDCADLPADVAKPGPGLRDIRQVPQGTSCFSYSVGMPMTDRDAAQRALRDIRRAPEVGGCFSY